MIRRKIWNRLPGQRAVMVAERKPGEKGEIAGKGLSHQLGIFKMNTTARIVRGLDMLRKIVLLASGVIVLMIAATARAADIMDIPWDGSHLDILKTFNQHDILGLVESAKYDGMEFQAEDLVELVARDPNPFVFKWIDLEGNGQYQLLIFWKSTSAVSDVNELWVYSRNRSGKVQLSSQSVTGDGITRMMFRI